MNVSDIPTQPIDCLGYWITRTLARCSSLTVQINEHDHLGNMFEDLSEMHRCMYAAKHCISLIKNDKISLK